MSDPAPSPFLPNTNIRYAWDSTCLGALKICPRLYFYQYIEGWSSEGESIHLRFGTEYHKALEDFDRRMAEGWERESAVRSVVHELMIRTSDWAPDQESRAGKYKNRASLVRTVVDYLDHYADDAAQTYVKADGAPAVELSFRFELEWGPGAGLKVNESQTGPAIPAESQPYLLCGHLDRVVTFSDDLFVADRKTTTSTLSSHYFQQWSPHNQMSLYTLASQVILDSPVKGVIIDAAQITIEGSRFVRGITYRTPDQLDEWLFDLRVLLAQAEAYATEGYWPMNDVSCTMYGGCRFQEVCSKSPAVREQFLKSRFSKLDENARWNPLRPR